MTYNGSPSSSPQDKEETIKSFRLSTLERKRTFVDIDSSRIIEQESNPFNVLQHQHISMPIAYDILTSLHDVFSC